jgi:hypothetical protein
MKLKAAMEKIKSMNMELKEVALRQDMSDMEVILITAHLMQTNGYVCRRGSHKWPQGEITCPTITSRE